MSTDCNDLSLPGNGTNRSQRLLSALLPTYVKVDERGLEELLQYAQNLAAEIRFMASDGNWDGDWEAFFNQRLSSTQETAPHFALFYSFLKLFSFAQQDINTLTQRHMDFYFKEVLKIKEKTAVPDQVYLIVDLAKHISDFLLEKKTSFKAGKDDLGKEILFEANESTVLNKTKVSSIKALFKDSNGRLYKSPIANSVDGIGGELLSEEKDWSPFGRPTELHPSSDRELARVGFAFSSPILRMAESKRKIVLQIRFSPLEGLYERLISLSLDESFELFLSGEKDWIPGKVLNPQSDAEVESAVLDFLNSAKNWQEIAGIEPVQGRVFDDPEQGNHRPFKGYDIGEITAKNILNRRNALPGGKFRSIPQVENVRGVGDDKIHDLKYSFRNTLHRIKQNGDESIDLILTCMLYPEDPSVVNYDQKVLLQKFQPGAPVMKIILAPTIQSYAYLALSEATIEEANIEVEVSNVRNLVLQNDQTLLPIGKNIEPFSSRPLLGSNFYIGSQEVFSKKLSDLKLNLSWHGLPEETTGFKGYYTGYSSDRSTEDFQVRTSILSNTDWIEMGSGVALFEGTDTSPVSSKSELIIDSPLLPKIIEDPQIPSLSEWKPAISRGFLKLSLQNGDFGHKDFPVDFAKQVLADEDDPTLPKEPYTPTLQEVSLDYSASSTIDLSGKSDFDSFYHVGAFGEAAFFKEKEELPLLPIYNSEGELMIGLSDHKAAQQIQLLFHVLDGSANPDKLAPEINWSYLTNNSWKPFDKYGVLSDESNGLVQTGIISFAPPREADQVHSILENDLLWIKATVNSNSDAIPRLTQIMAQAIKGKFESAQNDLNRLKDALPAETISKLKNGLSAIKKINQPFASFGGKTQEESQDYYQRVSERLRHKQRAVTQWDYERLILEQFPEVFQVKCLNHCSYDGDLTKYRGLAPRNVTVVVISNVKNKNALDPLRPKTSVAQLEAIKDFLYKIYPPGVILHVVNPIYEELQIKTKVRLQTWADQNFFGKKLEDDLKSYFSPWAFASDTPWTFGSTFHQSQALHFVEKLAYVDFLSCFEMYHIIRNPSSGELISRKKVEEAKGSVGVSILGSTGAINTYEDHLIEILETDDCECEENEVIPTITISGSESGELDEAFDN